MKIYSLLLLFKRASLCSIILFFLSFFICVLFEVVFSTMVCVTLPFVLFTFMFYSVFCFIEDFIESEKFMNKNKNNVIEIDKCRSYDKRNLERKNFDDFEKSSAC